MLASLSIRDIVLIEKMTLTFEGGLCTLTGETGAGKSILLDALGLALGARAEARLIRRGSQQAVVAAGFEVEPDDPLIEALETQGVDLSDVRHGDLLILKRTLSSDGRSRAFVNDQPVSASMLRELGDRFVEVQGQFEQRGLLNPSSHRVHLDGYANLTPSVSELADLWNAWKNSEAECAEERRLQEQASRDEAYLRHDLAELDSLRPAEGESTALAERRALLKNREKVISAVEATERALSDEADQPNARALLHQALNSLETVRDLLGEPAKLALQGLVRAEAEIDEALGLLTSIKAGFDLEDETLEQVEERYFALNDLARKHGCDPNELPSKHEEIRNRLESLESGSDRLVALNKEVERARTAYLTTARRISAARQKAAKALDLAITKELKPLKLDRAHFTTHIEELPEDSWNDGGVDQVRFMVSTNPGQPPGPLTKIASGGELSRFLLALKVVLAESRPGQTLVFDEVDSGIGGATADAVGERLAKLAADRQVLVVTHSPQVAARARHHWVVQKGRRAGGAVTRVSALDSAERREEIARMLSGAEITEEARAAASRLMGAAS
jgi:DNA repair protein RecN (Recombination protein N)